MHAGPIIVTFVLVNIKKYVFILRFAAGREEFESRWMEDVKMKILETAAGRYMYKAKF